MLRGRRLALAAAVWGVIRRRHLTMGRGGHGGGGFGGHGGGGFGHGGFGHGGFGHGGLFWGPGFGMYGPMWMGLWFGPPWMRGPLIFYLLFVLLYALGIEWCDWRCDDPQLVGYFGFGWFCALLCMIAGLSCLALWAAPLKDTRASMVRDSKQTCGRAAMQPVFAAGLALVGTALAWLVLSW